MLTKVISSTIVGIEAMPITVETVTERGAQLTIVGMADKSVKESYTRVAAAITASGISFPHRRTTINLSPAGIRKEGSAFDLPIAIGILASNKLLEETDLSDCMIAGELSLDGSVLPVSGVLPMAICARNMGLKRFIVPQANVTEAAVVNNLDVYGVSTLSDAIALLKGESPLEPTRINTRALFAEQNNVYDIDFSDVKGQEVVKRALEVACAGGHNILLVGSPGSGKSMMAKRIPSILPPLNMHEALETTKIHSVAGTLQSGSMLMTSRPFRSPHHTISPVALVGGGTNPHPGEISLAHNGVLYLDEFPEFQRSVLEVMRSPLEDRQITIARAAYSVKYPASFMLVASMNPCPCGWYGHPTKRCTCAPGAVSKYMNRISGPLLDRIDLQIEIAPVAFDDMTSTCSEGRSSEDMRRGVMRARQIQEERYKEEPGIYCNAQMNTRHLRKYAWPDEEGLEKLRERMTKLNMSARAFDRILRVARTIADLEGCESVNKHHVAEAISYRNLDKGDWGEVYY